MEGDKKFLYLKDFSPTTCYLPRKLGLSKNDFKQEFYIRRAKPHLQFFMLHLLQTFHDLGQNWTDTSQTDVKLDGRRSLGC